MISMFYMSLTEAIRTHTGLSPQIFFTLLILMITVYRFVSGMFVLPEDEAASRSASAMPHPSVFAPPPEPVHIGDMTLEELKVYDGSDPKKNLLMAIKGQVYDVSKSRIFYGPGGNYSLFAGKDATRALALMSFDPKDLTSDIDGLSSDALDVLQDWEYKFMEKYVKVGQIVTQKQSESNGGQDS
ncbi:Membrane-associated progesterone receptor component 1 [Zostera marina]|uniref:Membrane-associated progesterone receptor component 1 n=1 Tax=Zostera marina TaxID=29655 RepID=A0A0K9NQP1_ZOSMR|nr:Membrane-associated progesterone receptor component 1 [Zostera marina]